MVIYPLIGFYPIGASWGSTSAVGQENPVDFLHTLKKRRPKRKVTASVDAA